MKCSLVRDLLPLYIEKECSTDTKKLIDSHLKYCAECRYDYELMEKPLEMEVKIEEELHVDKIENTNSIWRKYYGNLIFKGILLFLIVYFCVVFIAF